MFDSTENLKMVWKLLSEKRELTKTNHIFFNTIVEDIKKNSKSFSSLLDMNKYLIQVCNNKFSHTNLQTRVEDIEQMKRGIQPKKIDFADKPKKRFENIDVLINKTMKEREKELVNYTQNFKTKEDLVNTKIKIGERLEEPNLIKSNGVSEKKVSFDLNTTYPKIYAKINLTENGIQKTIFCNIDKHFRLFLGSSQLQDEILATINNIEIALG